jgi:hypothetical protein
MFAGYFKHASQKITMAGTALAATNSDTIQFLDSYFVVERINPVVYYTSNIISNAAVTFKFQRSNKYLSDNEMPLACFFIQSSTDCTSLENIGGKPLMILPPKEQVIIELTRPSAIGGQVNLSISFEFEGYYVSQDNFRIDNSGLNKALIYALID